MGKSEWDLAWLCGFDTKEEDIGFQSFLKTVDTVFTDRKELYIGGPGAGNVAYGEQKIVVVKEDPVRELKELIALDGDGILIAGSSMLIQTLKAEGLIGRFILSVYPLFLGSGIRPFREDGRREGLGLLGTRIYENGMIQIRYKTE